METGPSSTQTTDSDVSSNGLETKLRSLEISTSRRDDETFLSPESGSLVSSTSDEAPAAKPTTSHSIHSKKLNEYLVSTNIAPVTQPWMEWDKVSDSTKRRYTKQTVEIVSSVLHTLSPNDPGSLWQAIVSSPAMNKALELDDFSKTARDYLQALTEAYNQAHGWDTRRQILSIMSGVASFKAVSGFIPGLTRYRFTLANMHRLQYGRGAPVPHQPSPRIRVDQQQLDHFLSFITSPHLVQDLPFGQKTLKLSSGKLIEIPNVIRTMIPQRIARQYSHYCKETNFKSFSERTMLRVLAECKASVRKSLQGLDYFAVDGARAFEDLDNLVRQLGDLGQGRDWQVQHIELLKAAKSYIKGDFKVTLFVNVTLALQREVNSNMLNTMRCLSPIRKWKKKYCNWFTTSIYTSRYIHV